MVAMSVQDDDERNASALVSRSRNGVVNNMPCWNRVRNSRVHKRQIIVLIVSTSLFWMDSSLLS